MKSITHPVAVALGMATLSTLSITGPLVSYSHLAVYHLQGSAAVFFIPATLDLLLLWAVLAGVLWLAERFAGGRRMVWSVLFVALPVILLKNWVSLAGIQLWNGAVLASICVPLAGMVWLALRPGADGGRIFSGVQDFAATLLGFSSLLGALLLVQLVWFGWEARNLNAPPVLHRHVGAARTHPRVIWIVLDELSFLQTYERRASGLNLPAFDRLAEGATVFTHTRPAGDETRLVLPTLMTGIPVDGIEVSADGQLRRLKDDRTGGWTAFDPEKTVFTDAIDEGYRTGLAGWYNPYCRILPGVLDHCFWASRLRLHGHMTADRSIAANFFGPFKGLTVSVWHHLLPHSSPPEPDTERTAIHVADYVDLLKAGDALLNDGSVDFMLLHMPVPHPGGIFDRRRGEFATVTTSYVDNLALADRYLGHVRELLEKRGEWDGSTVLVMGDHSWRTKRLWAGREDWTADDEAASHGGQFDDRPTYIVKLPMQHEGARVDEAFRAVRTRALLDELLAGRVKDAGELKAWVVQGEK